LTLAVSEQDRDWYIHEYLAKNAQILENGVDLDYFQKAPPGIAERLKLVFVGMMGWMPNSDGIKYFVSEILPRIRKEFPDIEIDIVGKDPPEDIVKLSEMPGIRVTGTVDDVRPFVWGAQVYVVPLRFGGGTRLKILEAFAMHKPVVSTSLGCEGIECRNGKELIIADSPSDFADAVILLLHDPAKREALSSNALQLVEATYGWQRLGDKLLHYYDELVQR
jgi:glycosyltransferase involved in cell wall biosynthesis